MTRDPRPLGDDDIRRIAGRVESHDHERIAPPAAVWDNIAAELEVETATSEARARRAADRRWFRRQGPLMIAAASVLLLGVVATVLFSTEDLPESTELANASMTDEGLPVSTNSTANASIVCTDDGVCEVDVDLSELPDAGEADLELWVINGDVTDMHSLGLVTGSGRYPLPDGVTHDGFPIVDISVEPRDGDETHSGQSVLRGVFTEV